MSMLAMLGALGAGAITTAGSLYQNQQNLKQTNKWNDVQIDLANTAHQREVMDLRAAGLNPILSAAGSGAQVPSLGAAEFVNPGQGIADGISSASNLMSSQYRAQVANLKANTEKVNAESSAVHVHNDLVQQQSESEKIRQDILKNDFNNSTINTVSNYVKQSAYIEALTGQRDKIASDSIDWDDRAAVKTYENLVQTYRNQIQRDRYMNSLERQLILDSGNSARTIKEIKSFKKGRKK